MGFFGGAGPERTRLWPGLTLRWRHLPFSSRRLLHIGTGHFSIGSIRPNQRRQQEAEKQIMELKGRIPYGDLGLLRLPHALSLTGHL